MIRNPSVRKKMKDRHIPQWKLAEALNVHENTVYRMLRQELSEERQKELIEIIESISE